MNRILRIVGVAIFLCAAVFASGNDANAQPTDDAEITRAIDERVKAALEQPGAVGFSVAVARDDQVIMARGYGLAEAEHKVPADAETMFRIGSVTKQFTAAAIMRLYEQGKLSLDDDLRTFLPDYPTQGHTVTIRHLLTHTSGIYSYTSDGEFMLTRTGVEKTHDEVLAEFMNEPFDFAPGEKWAYSNSGYYLLGMIVEKVSGKPYPAYVQDEFFTPLGLKRTRYDSTSGLIPNRAQGYRYENGSLLNDLPMAMSIPGGAGGLISTAQDLVRWQRALVNGEVVNPDSVKQMCSPVKLAGGQTRDYGFGIVMKEYRGHPYVGHAGGIFGFNSVLYYFPDHRIHIAVLSNSQDIPSGDLFSEIASIALGLGEEQIHDLELTADDMQRYTGTYQLADLPMQAKIFVRDGKLYSQATDQPEFRLMAQGEHEFRADFDTSVRLVFSGEGDVAPSFVLHQGGGKITASRVIDLQDDDRN